MSDEKVVNMNSSSNGSYRKYVKFSITIAVFLLLFFLLLSSMMIVKEGEYKVVRQFGEVVSIKEEPGLAFKVPFIQSATTLSKKKQVYDVDEKEVNTLDKKRIIIDNYTVWKITDPEAMISNAKTVINAEARMGEFIFSVVRSELGQMKLEEIVNDEKSSRGNIDEKITKQVNDLLKRDNYGVEVLDVRIKRTDLPEENEQSVFRNMISDRETKAQEYLSQGEAEKNRIVAQTDREVQEMLSKANKQAAEIRAEGEQEAAKIYNESFKKDEQFYQLYRTLESYKKTIDGETTIILPQDSPYAKALLGYID
ncbi:protease modulator HflC [Pontibacillus litoralis]|uniref:Protein HflC n=1 Tax=Pontibacillus litoralis JSM 072002 TaxID=1385512 RepID=A0A0A5G7H7_9BACI|nr:protease modulator HflC [Pontibacillus litoralis]KGX89086.1 tail fiber protein [Pontibacillus litoralis JSM 072002]